MQRILEERDKISIELVSCKADGWCQHIIPLDILLPLLNLQRRYHSNEIERIKELYEASVCCPGEGNM